MTSTEEVATCCIVPLLMATSYDGQLTENQIVRFARAVSSRDMESIALGYLDIEDPIIKNMKLDTDNAEAFNREIIRHWMHKNPEQNQCQVKKFRHDRKLIFQKVKTS